VAAGSRRRFIAGIAAAGASALARPIRAQTLQPVQLGATPSDDMTPILYARKAGWFAKAGLDVQLTNTSSGAATAAAVSAGTFAFGKSSLTTLLIAHEKGLPYTLVAADVVYDARSPYAGFITSPDARIKNGKDFADKLVAVSSLGDMGSVALQAWVDEHGGDGRAIKFVEVPLSAALAAVDAHRVAAAEASIPVLAAALDGGKVLIPAYSTIAPTFLLAAWFTTSDYSQKHPDVVRAFAHVFSQAAAYANAHHAETVAMMAEFTGIDAGVIARMTRTIAGTALVPAQIQPVIEIAVKYGALKRTFPAREIIDPNALAPLSS
jgi:NitT/TauT family transport system substrate-binding protein